MVRARTAGGSKPEITMIVGVDERGSAQVDFSMRGGCTDCTSACLEHGCFKEAQSVACKAQLQVVRATTRTPSDVAPRLLCRLRGAARESRTIATAMDGGRDRIARSRNTQTSRHSVSANSTTLRGACALPQHTLPFSFRDFPASAQTLGHSPSGALPSCLQNAQGKVSQDTPETLQLLPSRPSPVPSTSRFYRAS